jgi:hypothetical protein
MVQRRTYCAVHLDGILHAAEPHLSHVGRHPAKCEGWLMSTCDLQRRAGRSHLGILHGMHDVCIHLGKDAVLPNFREWTSDFVSFYCQNFHISNFPRGV